MRRVIFFIWCSLSAMGMAQDNNELFRSANAFYNNGKYAEAIDTYQSIIANGVHSAELYFNLGNAHYKLNNIGPSIFYYEKALMLNPNDEEILNNLSYAQNMTIDAIDKVPDVGFSRIVKNIVNLYSADTWAIIAIGGVLIFVILFLLYHFSRATTNKRIAFIVSVTGLCIALFALAMAYQKDRLERKDNPAIIFVQESRIKSDPNKTSEERFRLHEGTKVQILESYDNWYKIELSDKSTGWIPSQDLKPLR